MGFLAINCAVCGCPFSEVSFADPNVPNIYDELEYDSRVLSEQQTEWLQKFCVIGKTSSSNEEKCPTVLISSLASIPLGNGPFVSIDDVDNLFTDFRVSDSYCEWRVFTPNDAGAVLYPIHTSCLTIFNCATRWRKHQAVSEDLSNIATFYEVLCRQSERNETVSRRMDYDNAVLFGSNGLEWEHGYYGARQFWGQEWTSKPDWEWLCADPIAIPTLTSSILSRLHTAISSAPLSLPPSSASPPTQPSLPALPSELLTHITSYLPTYSTLRLRRCNRLLAERIPLTQTFWREQLLSGTLVPYLWDLDAVACREMDKFWDWEKLAMKLVGERWGKNEKERRIDLSNGFTSEVKSQFEEMNNMGEGAWGDEPLGLRNRRRIWKILENVL